MILFNLIFVSFSYDNLLENSYYQDKLEILKRIYPFMSLFEAKYDVAMRAINNEKFVNDYFKYSCNVSCFNIGDCIEYYDFAVSSENPKGETHFSYDEAVCVMQEKYESCDVNGYYNYERIDDSTTSFSTIEEVYAYAHIYDLVTMTKLTYTKLYESCIKTGDCDDYKETGRYTEFKQIAPTGQYISEVLASAVCDSKCVLQTCSNGLGVCLPDHCGIEVDGYIYVAEYDRYVCKVAKSYLKCNKQPEFDDTWDKIQMALCFGGIALGIILIIVITVCITKKCNKPIIIEVSSCYDDQTDSSESSAESKSVESAYEEA